MSNKSSSYHAKLETILVAESNVRKINEARQAEGPEEKVSKDDDDPQLIGDANTAMNGVLDINASSFSELSLDNRVALLNGDQRPSLTMSRPTFFTSNVMKLMNAHVTSNHFVCLSVV